MLLICALHFLINPVMILHFMVIHFVVHKHLVPSIKHHSLLRQILFTLKLIIICLVDDEFVLSKSPCSLLVLILSQHVPVRLHSRYLLPLVEILNTLEMVVVLIIKS